MLFNVLNLKSKKIISIVGAGGKTSLMFFLAKKLSKGFKVLVTTTTKIYIPEITEYDYIATDKNSIQRYMKMEHNGVYVFGKTISKENKIIGLDFKILNKLRDYFDYILIEADGAKQKPLKGWCNFEPVICDATDMTIGVIDIKVIGMKAIPKNIFRLDEFVKLSDIKKGEKIKVDHLVKMISHPKGLFKNAIGNKVVYINKVENTIDRKNCDNLVQKLQKVTIVDHIISGSIVNQKFKVEI